MNNINKSTKILKFYNLLNNSEKKNDLINDKIKELEKRKEVIYFSNKIKLFENLNNYKKCLLCLEENVLNICLECGHEICINCYADAKSKFKCVFNYCE